MSKFYSLTNVRKCEGFKCVEPDRTRQSFKESCDINNIIKRFTRSLGSDFLAHYAGYMEGKFGDASAAIDFHTARNMLIDAENAFLALPSAVRDRFANDPSRLLDFIGNSSNREEAVKLGLLKKTPKSEATTEKVVA